MSDLAEIRQGLIDTVCNFVETDLYGYAFMEDITTLPAVLAKPGGGGRDDKAGDFTVTMARGTEIWSFQLILLCQRGHPEAGQRQLDEFISKAGVNSIRQAIWNTPDLGLGDVDATITGISDYGAEWKSANVDNIGAAVHVKVHAF